MNSCRCFDLETERDTQRGKHQTSTLNKSLRQREIERGPGTFHSTQSPPEESENPPQRGATAVTHWLQQLYALSDISGELSFTLNTRSCREMPRSARVTSAIIVRSCCGRSPVIVTHLPGPVWKKGVCFFASGQRDRVRVYKRAGF